MGGLLAASATGLLFPSQFRERERDHNMVIHGALCCNASRSELRFNLHKPNLRIGCPVRRDLHSIGLNVAWFLGRHFK